MATTFLLLLSFYYLHYSSTEAQLLTITADNVTAPYNSTAVLQCVFTVNTTYNPLNNSNDGQKVNLTIGEIERTPPLARTSPPYTLTGGLPAQTLSLTLTNVLLADEGLFTCSATASITGYTETKTVNFTLSIKDYYTLILSLTAPINVTIMYNDQAVLNCSVVANETAVQSLGLSMDISIVKEDGSPISDHTESYDGMYMTSLVINNAQSSDSGTYQCIARIGEEQMISTFSLTVTDGPSFISSTVTMVTTILPSMQTSSPVVVPPSPSPSPDEPDSPQISETLLMIIIIAGIVGITAFVLLIVACYFIIANVNIVFCFKTDEMRMEEMDGKMRNSNKLKSVYDQELGGYANNEAYDIELDEEEIFEAMEEEHTASWYEHKEKKKMRRKKQVKKKRKSSSFALETLSDDEKKMPDSKTNKREPTFADELHRSKVAENKGKRRNSWQEYHHTMEGYNDETSDGPIPHSVSDQSDYSTDDDDDNEPPPRIPAIDFSSNKFSRIRRSSLQGEMDKRRPGLKKKVSMGSVEILDQVGDKVVPRVIEFNDVDGQNKDNSALKKSMEDEIYPTKKEKKKDEPMMKSMDDVMDYLDNARGSRVSPPTPVRKLSLQEPPDRDSVLPLAPILKPSSFYHEAIPTKTVSTTPHEDKRTDNSFFPWRRSSSVSLPKSNPAGSNARPPRRASIGSKPVKKSKSGKPLYGGTTNIDVFY